MTEKYVGYSLLATGILLMIFAVIQIIFVFTGRAEPAQVFEYNQPAPKIQEQDSSNQEALLRQLESGDLSSLLGSVGDGNDLSSLLGSSGMGNNLSGFGIDMASINRMLNLTVYYFIMQFILSLGFKLSSLGVQMVRPLEVQVKRNNIAEMIDRTEKQ